MSFLFLPVIFALTMLFRGPRKALDRQFHSSNKSRCPTTHPSVQWARLKEPRQHPDCYFAKSLPKPWTVLKTLKTVLFCEDPKYMRKQLQLWLGNATTKVVWWLKWPAKQHEPSPFSYASHRSASWLAGSAWRTSQNVCFELQKTNSPAWHPRSPWTSAHKSPTAVKYFTCLQTTLH